MEWWDLRVIECASVSEFSYSSLVTNNDCSYVHLFHGKCVLFIHLLFVVHPLSDGGDESGAFTTSVLRQHQIKRMRR